MINGLINKGHDESKLIFFPNWTDLDHFKNFINRDLLKELGIISNDKKVILYSGNIGKKQGLENLIYAAKILHDHDLVFLIVGDGASKNDLFLLSQKLELNNIHFLPLQPYEDLPLLLSIADCHIVSQKSGPDDAFLPSKLTNIFAVGGNSVITAPENSSLAKLCKDYNGIATLADPDSAKSLAEGILKSIECEKPNRIAEDYASTFLDKDIIFKKFIDNIKSKNYES
jgi:colanic acid biosynthesis glycosyl transferase WcaI